MAGPGATWSHHPDLPIAGAAPPLRTPWRPLAALRYLLSPAFSISYMAIYLATAFVAWFWLQPALSRCVTLEPGWIAEVLLRNLAITTVFAGGLHLWLWSRRGQGDTTRFDPRDMPTGDRRFVFGSQVRDNMFWTLASGVPLWTAYEAGFFWGYANDALPFVTLAESPVWFCLLFPIIAFWQSLHFWVIHRLLHWPPLYRLAHALHHKNVNIGPWSGIAMHPIEHVLYFSSVLLHLVLPSHPFHIVFHMHFLILSAQVSHAGFGSLVIGGREVIGLGSFYHQLHHRYVNCNFGTDLVPLDRWLGMLHDGTREASLRVAKLGRKTTASTNGR